MTLLAKINTKQIQCAVVGLGYVGLPVAVEFGKIVPTIGFDLNSKRIADLKNSVDMNGETTTDELQQARHLVLTDKEGKLKDAEFIVVAVPTPITKNKQPDLFCLKGASEIVGRNLKKGSIVVFESTVYPGVTEDFCVPIIEKESGLSFGVDFKVGYSPERINPGDKEHTLASIVKVVSGSDEDALNIIAVMYGLIVKAGIHKAESIKCAEAAKVIENTQRDLNIALMNELAIIFNKMGIDTLSVLKAAGTKWNFIKMTPGLVGGHCIGVDPYYLTYKAEEIGYHPQVILAGRKINDSMGKYIAEQTIKKLIDSDIAVKGSKVMVAGITFKEDVSDIRNSRVIDIIHELKEYGVDVIVCDPLADEKEVKEEYGLDLVAYQKDIKVDGIVLAVAHDQFRKQLTVDAIKKHFSLDKTCGVLIDIKDLLDPISFKNENIVYWRL